MPPGEFGVAPGTVTFAFDGGGGAQFSLRGFSSNGYDHGPFVRRTPGGPSAQPDGAGVPEGT